MNFHDSTCSRWPKVIIKEIIKFKMNNKCSQRALICCKKLIKRDFKESTNSNADENIAKQEMEESNRAE